MASKAEEQVAAAPTVTAPVAAPAPAPAPVPAAPEPAVAAPPAVPDVPDVVAAAAAAAPEPDVVVAAADVEPIDAAVAVADAGVTIGSTAPAKPQRVSDEPDMPIITKPKMKKVPPPKPKDAVSDLGKAFREAEDKKKQEREAQEARKKAFNEGLGKEFKKSQTK